MASSGFALPVNTSWALTFGSNTPNYIPTFGACAFVSMTSTLSLHFLASTGPKFVAKVVLPTLPFAEKNA